jgi:hypothetical protein
MVERRLWLSGYGGVSAWFDVPFDSALIPFPRGCPSPNPARESDGVGGITLIAAGSTFMEVDGVGDLLD